MSYRTIEWVCVLLLCTTMAQAEKLNFNPDWLFIRADPAGASMTDYDDSEWGKVSTPHTFNDIDTFDNWSPTWKGHMGEYEQWSGRTWYRKHFNAPSSWQDKKVFIEFESARQTAEVFINGTMIGKNENGFIPFGFDLTPHLKFGKKNVLAVMCDNSFVSDADGNRANAKWHAYEGGAKFSWNNPHWHPAHGGLYRNVFLHIKNRVHITLPLYDNLETVGTYIYTPNVTDESAEVGFEAEIRNATKAAVSLSLVVEILDIDGNIVEKMQSSEKLKAGDKSIFKTSCVVKEPHLWEPDYPYLYTARARVFQADKLLDTVDTPLGIRYWKFTKNDGFHINGHRVKLQGWGQKPTNEWPGLGNAHPDWMHILTLGLMREGGGNFVRWGHAAGAPVHIRGADRLGIITVQPGVDGEGDVEGHCWDVRAKAFRDLIVYYRNYPSILIWEGGNQAVSKEHVTELRGYVSQYDPYGKRAYAHRRPSITTIAVSDIEIGTEGSHKYHHVPVVEGEYNREESPRRVWDKHSPPDYGYKVKGKQEYVLTSEQYAINQVSHYVQKLGDRDHCGGANWIFTDSTSGGRNNCEVTRASGEVDAARLPKEAFYACKAMFSSKPHVHIIGHWTYPNERKVKKDIFVVSNAKEVELFLNDKSLGKGEVDHRHLFKFKNITYAPGKIEAVAYDNSGNAIARQTKETVGQAVDLKLTPLTGPKGLLATGSDVLLVDVEAVDAQGRRHPTVQQRVDFDISGPGVWRGGYNSGRTNSINHKYLDIECGVNRIAVRSTRTPGPITITARSQGLKPATVSVESKPVRVKHGVSTMLPPVPPQERPDSANIPTRNESDVGETREESEGRFIKGFSYSGHTLKVAIPIVKNGAKVYLDRDYIFRDMPDFLLGADYVQLPNNEKLYEALDLMDFWVAKPGTLFIAHDDRLIRPAWLLNSFHETDHTLSIHDARMTIFKRQMKAEDSITIGSNRETGPTACTMYVVFFATADM